jgi:YesN/AraC family two-component response regulator
MSPIGRAAQTVVALQASGDPVAPERMLRVLIIEDSPIVRERLIALIDQLHLPIRVAAVADGLQAVLRFEKLCPDAVVLDIELPGLNGFDLLAQFKLQRPGCVVIMLTTYAYPEFRENAMRLGADHFFDKAMEFERVTEVLSALVATLLAPV